ncbi:MAG: signal peptidase I [bacterium]|nr:signal peptidase I [bacterium]
MAASSGKTERARFGIGLFSLVGITALLCLIIWAAVVPLVLGWSSVAVVSGSMEPGVKAGDVVVASPHDGLQLGPGTVIVFDSPSRQGQVTHRIVDVEPSGNYVTRGDRNPRIDSDSVQPGQISGVGRILVPFVGKPYEWVHNGDWLKLALAGLALVAALGTSRWALLDKFDPWRVEEPETAPESARILQPSRSNAAGLVTMLLVASVVTGAGSHAAFAVGTDSVGNSWTGDVLTAPGKISASGGASITIEWAATTDTYATGHRVLRATSSGGPYSQIAQITPRTTTTYVDSPAPGTYYYVVRAYYLGWESTDSSEVTATVAKVDLAGSWMTGLSHPASAGSNRLLVFAASNEESGGSTPTLTSVSYGGQALTYVASEQLNSGSKTALIEFWILDEAGIAAATDATLVPVWTGTPDAPLYSHVIVENVDQTTPTGASVTASNAGDTPNPITVGSVGTSNFDMVIAAATAGVTGFYNPQNGFVVGTNEDRTSGNTTALGTAYKPADGSNETAAMLFVSDSPPSVARQVVVAFVINVSP